MIYGSYIVIYCIENLCHVDIHYVYMFQENPQRRKSSGERSLAAQERFEDRLRSRTVTLEEEKAPENPWLGKAQPWEIAGVGT